MPSPDAEVGLPDDPTSVDPDGMLATVLDAPAQWRLALETARRELAAGTVPRDPEAVVVAGMGGSGIAGDVAVVLAENRGRVPVVAVKDYRLPAWVGPGTLAVVVSHSGDTEESLAAARHAAAVGASLVAVTTGGRLRSRTEEAGQTTVVVPGGLPPRASLAYLVVPVLVALERAGVLADVERELAGVPDQLGGLVERWRPDGEDGDRPLAVAQRLVRATPWFLGARGLGAVIAHRGRCQINENAERVAHASELPEADHNEIVGWAGDRQAPASVLIEIRDPGEDARVARRFRATREVAAGAFADVLTHRLPGPDLTGRLAGGALFVDLVSVLLAHLTRIDPTPVAAITDLKRRLAD